MHDSIRTTLVLLAVLASPVLAQSEIRLEARPDSRLWLEGTSNVMAWSCRATSIDATVEVKSLPTLPDPSAIADALERVTVRVPVGNLQCGNRHMDRNMYRALDADDPDGSYIVGSFRVRGDGRREAQMVRTTGTLTVAGRNRAVDVDVHTRRAADGTLVAEGSLPVLMTDFGISPPRVLFGAIRTGNRVMVRFELHVATASAVATTAQR